MKILIVDDDKMFRDSLQLILSRAGHEVVLAQNGKEGLALWTSMPIDLVLTDLIMPDHEGMELIFALRKKTPPAKIIAMSGRSPGSMEAYLPTASHLGAIGTLVKPFTSEQLFEAIGKVYSAKKAI